ncbi:TPA_asm: DUF2157 domain-containing protein, partial [Salmonella enterica subsp. enterica serovar Enteritidis str. P125109]|nr:DUF2157 domain-containing protein [Salmonella enterica subsp. enterica serovar Enteritidis str. P125109]
NYEKQRSTKQRLPLLLIVGGTFVVLAVFSFLSANWQAMPIGWKIGLVVALMWICYIMADLSERRRILHPVVFRIGGILAFGASILVVVQSFHLPMEGSLLSWCMFVAALVHYMLWRHEAYGVVAFLSGWTIFTSLGGFGQEQASYLDWTSFGLMVVLSFNWFYFSQRLPSLLFSWLFLFFSGLSLFLLVSYDGFLWPIWTLFLLVPVLWLVREESNRRIVEMVYLVVAAISSIIYLSVRAESNVVLPSVTEAVLLAIVSTGLGIFLYQKRRGLLLIVPLGFVGVLWIDEQAILLAILFELSALLYLLYRERRHAVVWPAFLYFILVQIAIYVIYAWDRLNMSLFFLIGALLIFLLSGVLWWLRRKGGVAS